MEPRKRSENPRIGLILSGGGARAAYQVGVLKAIAEILPKESSNPFTILCGTSAGAINATTLAIYATRFRQGVRSLAYVWKNFTVDQVFRADALGTVKSGARWLAALLLGGLGRYNPHALLDRTPLYHLLERYLPLEKIQASIDAGVLHALCVTAAGYSSGQSVSFFQGVDSLTSWKRARRLGSVANITMDHLMASSAIPFVFSAVKINREYFGDGSMRQIAPISPALHLGADRVLVIGVRQEITSDQYLRSTADEYPSLAQVAGNVLNSIFLDSLEADLERLQRINKTISMIPADKMNENDLTLRHIDVLMISPSQDLEIIAARHAHTLPRPLRFLLRGIGAFHRDGSNLISYLLFEKPFCRELIALGYADTMQRKQEVFNFLSAG